MRTFLRLNLRLSLFTFICIGLALMIGGNAVAQQPAQQVGKIRFVAETDQELVIKPIEVGDTIPLTITLSRNNVPVVNTTVQFSPVKPGTATVNPAAGTTNARGEVTTNVTFHRDGDIDIRVVAPALASVYTHTFKVGVRDETRIVATPVDANGLLVGDLAVGSTFTYEIEIKDVADLAAWQMDVVFDPGVVKVMAVSKGDFLDANDIVSVFSPGKPGAGKIMGISQARVPQKLDAEGNPMLTTPPVAGVSGSGQLVSIDFQVIEFAETTIGLQNVQLSESKIESPPWFNDSGDPSRISHYVITNPVVVTHQYPKEDVNRDGTVDILDLVSVAGNFGKASGNPRADLNDDGMITILDVVLISQHANWGKAVTPGKVRNQNDQVGTAPSLAGNGQPVNLTSEAIQGWIDLAQVEDDGSAIFDLGIANLEALLASRIPSETKLLLNYPNPFNPETWIPYQLAKATEVSISIYAVNGNLVRTLALGHQAAGMYQNKSQAAYWDGRNELGERVASGVYFYTFTAGSFSATGKMLVRK